MTKLKISTIYLLFAIWGQSPQIWGQSPAEAAAVWGQSPTAVAQAEFEKYYLAVTGKAAPRDTVTFAIDPAVSKTGKDAYSIVSCGKGAKITGSNVRNILYGVYDLLERRAGCHWFWDGDVVPKRETIDLSGLDIHEEAHFEYRGLRYFAHRGLTRFQAEHWGFDDWKKEIDWMLKRRLNVFMLRIGQDDLFQRTFPDICGYPDPSKDLPGAGEGYDNRTLFWSLQYRGELRRRIQAYAFERGLMAPEDFGTMTHWYSRTPEDFLEKMNPPFLPQATSGYAERNGLVWDVRDDRWADEYWKLTKTAVDAYGKGAPQRLLHTIGLGERRCYTNRQDNFNLKVEVLDKFLARAHRDYPDAKVLLAGWDLYFTWFPEEVRALVGRLDPKRDIIWDYEGDATRDWRKEMQGLNNNFTKWGVVGKFPYTYSIFLAYESALDARANYPLIEERQKIVQNDPACVGYIFWPEASHTDTLCLRYFTANAWANEAVPHGKVLDEFCASRYGTLAGQMKAIWEKALPASMLRDWDANYGRLVTGRGESLPPCDEKTLAAWKQPVETAQAVFGDLADIPWADDFLRRDTIDVARMVLDRVITLRTFELSRDVAAWQNGSDAQTNSLAEKAKNLAALCDRMADLLELHTDYSLWESYLRQDAVEKVRNPDFPKTLFDNASCSYCRSHQYELARYWYAPRMKKMASRLADAIAAGDRNAKLFDDRDAERRALMARPLESLKPVQPRTRDRYRETMQAIAKQIGTAFGTQVSAPDALHARTTRLHEGIPSVEVSPKNGRIWATWYGSPTGGEDSNNYAVLATSADGGDTWKEVSVADPDGEGPVRAFDPEIWISPDGKLRWFWTERVAPLAAGAKNRNAGCLASPTNDVLMMAVFDNAEDDPKHLPVSRKIARGVMMAKPIVSPNGDWLFPVANWFEAPSGNVWASSDCGGTFRLVGGVTLPKNERLFDEHNIYFTKSGELACWLRTRTGWMHALSPDGGRTWGAAECPRGMKHTSSRFVVKRLSSGNLLLIKHGKTGEDIGRAMLTAYVSLDDGKTWKGGLLLDARRKTSYPDAVQTPDGVIHAVHDFDRTGKRHILYSTFTEADILAGHDVSGKCRLSRPVNE